MGESTVSQRAPYPSLPKKGVRARGLWSGHGFITEFIVAAPDTYALRGKPVNTYGPSILVVSSTFPDRPSRGPEDQEIPTQTSIMRDFLMQRKLDLAQRALRAGETLAEIEPSRSTYLTHSEVKSTLIEEFVDSTLEAYMHGDLGSDR